MTTTLEKSTINSADFLATLEQRNKYIGLVRAYKELVENFMVKKLYDYQVSYISELPNSAFALRATYMLHLLHKFDMDIGQCTPQYHYSSNSFGERKLLLDNLDLGSKGVSLYSCKLENNNQRSQFSLDSERGGRNYGEIDSELLLKTLNDPGVFSKNYDSEKYNKVDLEYYFGAKMYPTEVKFGSESPKALVKFILENVRGGIPPYHQPHEFHSSYKNIFSFGDKKLTKFDNTVKEQISTCFKKYFDDSNTDKNKLKCFNPTIDANEPAEVIHSKIRAATDEFVAQAKTHCYNKAINALDSLNHHFISILQQGSNTDEKLVQLEKAAKDHLDECAFVFPFKTSADESINEALTDAVNSGYLATQEDNLHCKASEYSEPLSDYSNVG